MLVADGTVVEFDESDHVRKLRHALLFAIGVNVARSGQAGSGASGKDHAASALALANTWAVLGMGTPGPSGPGWNTTP